VPPWRKLTLLALIGHAVDNCFTITTGVWIHAVSNTIVAALELVARLKSTHRQFVKCRNGLQIPNDDRSGSV
jgi:hypothetical protein